ncbi:uncharacterized protein SCHCODRAFT_02744024 [Schizophyllum commune H4-8]|nr:uncharacterized protein SCHCODRAFT_02744024 [Schizophyllum commune H4-8]KAI5897669.1 hypothetical protein SCHCODRAFT_02744024 [Schizophyllum commune H4-8]
MVGYVTLDDQSTNASYSGDWGVVLNDSPSYENTEIRPERDGASFSLQFYGHKVAVRGVRTNLSGGIQIAFSVDGGENDTVTFEAFESTESRLLYDNELWKSETLGDIDEMHVLTGQVSSTSDEKALFLDSFRIYQASLDQQTISSGSPSTGISTGTSGTSTGTSYSLPPGMEPTVSGPYVPPPSNSASRATEAFDVGAWAGIVVLIAALSRLL